MAGTKISALTAAAALGGTEEIPGVQSAANVKITPAQIKTFTSASPTLVTPALGVAAGTSLALGGATIGSNALAVTGAVDVSGKFVAGNGVLAVQSSTGKALLYNNGVFGWTNGGTGDTTADTGFSRISAGVIGVGTGAAASVAGSLQAASYQVAPGTAIPAGGTAGLGYKVSSTANFGVFFGSGAPTLSAAKGSLYLRSDGSTTNDRAYINTDGGTTWTALTTAA